MKKRILGIALAIAAVAPGAPQGRASALAFLGVRPGTWMYAPSLCTMNFIFNRTGTLAGGGPFYIGTAKHCVMSSLNEDPRGKPVQLGVMLSTKVASPALVQIGAVAWVTKGEMTIGNDYALVRIDPKYDGIVSPSIAVIGGPTSVAGGEVDDPVLMVGHGAALGAGGTARAGLVTSQSSPYGIGWVMPVIAGDSGSPVRSVAGAAIGDVTEDGVNRFLRYGETPTSTVYGTLVQRVVDETGLRVVTCGSVLPWPSFGCPPLNTTAR